jgi:hypothetical protein
VKTKLVLIVVVFAFAVQAQPIYRQFGTKLIDVSQPSELASQRGKVAWVQNGIVGLNLEKATGEAAIGSSVVPTDWEYDRLIAVTNYPAIATASVGNEIYIKTIKIGLFDGYQDQPIDLYDCGSVYRPPPPSPEQLKAAQAAAQLRAVKDRQRYLIGETNSVRFLLTEATNGSPSAQYSLGEHYLAGLGCETNREQAIYWFTQAAKQGSIEASNKLSSLK